MTALLSLNNVSREFGTIQALTNISMDVAHGELRAIIGPNGAGKTTLFNLISGFYAPTGGQIMFDGRSVGETTSEQLVHMGMIRTFQITEIFGSLSVHDNARIAVETALGLNWRPWLRRENSARVEHEIDALLRSVGLESKAGRVAGELAHGDQRVVEVAVALARRPKLLLLDEPTAGMGDEETERMTELVRALHVNDGLSILLIEHDMSIIFGLADKITVLDNGKLLAQGTPAEISENERVQVAYLGGER